MFKHPRRKAYLMKNSLFSRFLKDEKGATAIEYAFIVVGISIGIGATINLTGGDIGGIFNAIEAAL